MKTFASLFSGGGLADVGAISASLKLLWACEYDAKIAECYKSNLGDHVIVAPVQDVDYSSLETPYWLHMSPPCTNASTANTAGGETELDIELAQACIRAVSTLLSPVVSLENVYGYREFESFRGSTRKGDVYQFEGIAPALRRLGYSTKYWHLNSANYAVPQTRKRLFLVASRIKQPQKPPVTHQRRDKIGEQLSFFPLLPWVGWLEAIEDLVPTLPDSQFAPWQIPLLPEELQTMLIANGKYDDKLVCVRGDSHSGTITSNTNQGSLRAVLIGNSKGSREGYRHHGDADSPAHTITGGYGQRARAWLVPDGNKRAGCRKAESPAQTVTIRKSKAFIVDGQTSNGGSMLTCRQSEDPIFTLAASQEKRPLRAYTEGRVVKMTPRALARFQSMPDWYKLPEKSGLACVIIGNGVPCLMFQRLIEANL